MHGLPSQSCISPMARSDSRAWMRWPTLWRWRAGGKSPSVPRDPQYCPELSIRSELQSHVTPGARERIEEGSQREQPEKRTLRAGWHREERIDVARGWRSEACRARGLSIACLAERIGTRRANCRPSATSTGTCLRSLGLLAAKGIPPAASTTTATTLARACCVVRARTDRAAASCFEGAHDGLRPALLAVEERVFVKLVTLVGGEEPPDVPTEESQHEQHERALVAPLGGESKDQPQHEQRGETQAGEKESHLSYLPLRAIAREQCGDEDS
mmetsp:Transcript_44178/g.116089  ORF Transcript_44178/g.116089 Transcript_44178/m.116089 type:complete len:272 (-) Transcript_44178:677-1492(-)